MDFPPLEVWVRDLKENSPVQAKQPRTLNSNFFMNHGFFSTFWIDVRSQTLLL